MFTRIDTVFLQVIDFGKAIEWYSTVLGFPVRWRDDQGGYAALEIGETPLTLVRSERVIPSSHMPFNSQAWDGDSSLRAESARSG
ncbi:VOC family protein [Cytobacillus pseudoceanisediminis]|uniref:VOC family protein n=1 Tax=Cytobacillus pseudoceanisediminis TaxID=3051614 RepID=A0ABZ2ZMB1_9BACI